MENTHQAYDILISWSEVDQAYVTRVPELAGCMADGETPQSAIENTYAVIKEWLEVAKELGRAIPKPRAYAGLAADSPMIYGNA